MIDKIKKKAGIKRLSANSKKIIFFLLLFSLSWKCFTQSKTDETNPPLGDTSLVNSLLQESKGYFIDSPAKAIDLAMQAKVLAENLHFQKGDAYALKNIGIAYYFQGKYLEALDYYQQSLKVFTEINDYVGMANIYGNIGAIYLD